MRNRIIIGNWKMNMKRKDVKEFIQELSSHRDELKSTNTIYGIAPVSLHLDMAKTLGFQGLNIVAQNCYFESSGAYTGEVSIDQLHDLEIKHVIVGHSERRVIFNESDFLINKKVLSLVKNNITAILCVGESLDQYESGDTNKVVKNQVTEGLKSVSEQELDNVIIAYEPVWAIGTGKTATSSQAQETIKYIRSIISELFSDEAAKKILIQYGGSVKPNNIKELLEQPDIDGALVGGASLDPKSFIELIKNSI